MRKPILSAALRVSASITALTLIGLSAAACVAPGELPSDEPASGEADQPILCGNEDWRDFTTFAGDPTYRIGAHYAKAVAALPGCSGALVGPGVLITANHCYRGDVTTAVFGVGWSGAEFATRGRLVDMGLTSTQSLQPSWSQLSTFTCTRRMSMATPTYGMRDLDVYDCAPNNIPNLGAVMPGDLWGYLQPSAGSRAEGTGMYVLSVNKASAYPESRILLSPGGSVTDSVDSCVATYDYDSCFEHDADTLTASSGGPILDMNHRLFGLVEGHYDADPGENSCDDGWATNYGTYLYSNGFASGWEMNDALPSPSEYVTTAWAGGTTGSLSSLACPTGTLAVGIVGTTYPYDPVGNARVGNFGLVCATYKRSYDPSLRTSTRWSVLAGGSYDTELGAWSWPFNEYIHEKLDLVDDGGGAAGFSSQQQNLTMCKPGFYMTGLQVHASGYLDKVVNIECTSFDRVYTQQRYPRKDVGTRSSTFQVVRCPDTSGSNASNPNRAIQGLKIRAGWLTDAIQVGCVRF